MNKDNTKHTILQRITTIIFFGIAIYSFIQLSSNLMNYFNNRQVLKEAQTIYLQSEEKQTSKVSNNQMQFEDLLHINPDIVGWIKIEDTFINYPIVQASDNEYYLNRNYKKETEKAGSIFMDYRNDIANENNNTILYGHRMKDGSMFAQLSKFLDEEFFKKHQSFTYETLHEEYEVKVFSIYKTTTDFNYIETDFLNDEDFSNFLSTIQEKSIYFSKNKVTLQDNIITLSTCDTGVDPEEGRLVLHGSITKK